MLQAQPWDRPGSLVVNALVVNALVVNALVVNALVVCAWMVSQECVWGVRRCACVSLQTHLGCLLLILP